VLRVGCRRLLDLGHDARDLLHVGGLLLGSIEARQRFRHTASLIPTNLVGFREMDEADEKVSLTSWVDRRERDKLLELAIRGDRTLSAEVRRTVAEHLERAEPEEQTR
jgi:hypothetical protein